MGIGIWSMHFIGMLSMQMPMIMSYNLWLTLASLGVAVVDVGQAQDRTTLLVDEAARRVGFDVQIRYTRIDERETASIEKIKI